MICLGGFSSASAALVLSKDRGHSWPHSTILWTTPTNVFFLNKDTIFGISSGGEFTKTTNGGLNWKLSNDFIIDAAYGIYFKNAKEGYITGKNSQNYGVVAKTTDLGETWITFNTGVKTTLMNLAVLNDSIAILTGTDGVLLRWKYKSTHFTRVRELHGPGQNIRIFPNPAKNKLYFDIGNAVLHEINLHITNSIGQTLLQKKNFDYKEGLDISFLNSGIYYLKVELSGLHKSFKISIY